MVRNRGSRNSDNRDMSDVSDEFLRNFQASLRRINSTNVIERSRDEEIEALKSRMDALTNENHLLKTRLDSTSRSSVNNSENRSVSNSVQLKDIQSSIAHFSGSHQDLKIENWIEEFESNVALFNLNPIQSLIVAKNALVDSAKRALNSRTNITSWDELKEMLLEEFSVKFSSAEIHGRLRARKKKKEESLKDYFFIMREIGGMGKVEEEAIIEYCIDGIDDIASNKILLYGAKTFGAFREKLNLYEHFISKNRVVHQSVKHGGQPKHSVRPSEAPSRCFNCGRIGHSAKFCSRQSDGPKCFKCGQYGHKSPECINSPMTRKENPTDKRREADDHHTTIGSITTPTLKSNHKIIDINGKPIDALIDTGSDYSLITEDEFFTLNSPLTQLLPIELYGIGKSIVQTRGCIKTDLTIDNEVYSTNLYVVSSGMLPVKCIVGYDVLRDAVVYTEADQIHVRRKFFDSEPPTCCVADEDPKERFSIGDKQFYREVENLLSTYNTENVSEIRECPIRMKLILKSEVPIWQPPRRLAACEKEKVSRQLEKWLRDDIIKPSVSEYASPIVLVNKKNGSKRICVDYRKLNKQIVMDRYPLPVIEDLVDQLCTARVFSMLDLENGFFHVRVDEESQKFTGFVTPQGHFEFQRVPFGLCTAPAIFQRFINFVFKELIANGDMMVYMDDVIIPSITVAENLVKLKKVLEVARSYNLQFKWEKCQFLFKQVEYLGYVIADGKIRPSQAQIQAVSKFPEPINVRSVQSFLGLTGYFRKFIQNYSIIAKPLTDLLKKDVKFRFEEPQKEAVRILKSRLINKPILSIYRQNANTELAQR